MTKTLNALLQIAAINPDDNCTTSELSLAVSKCAAWPLRPSATS